MQHAERRDGRLPAGRSLRIVREFRAERSRLWKAWTTPETMLRWLGPAEWPAVEVMADIRVGGAWRACLRARDDERILWQSGYYLAIEPPRRLEFTFAWEGSDHEDGPGVETLVTVILEETPSGGTRMFFTQSGLASDRSADGHSHGWNSTFDRLDRCLDPP